jgi:hypothetical protein
LNFLKSYSENFSKNNKNYYCNQSDQVKKISCLSWDQTVGAFKLYSLNNHKKISKDKFNFFLVISAMNLIQNKISGLRNLTYLNENQKPLTINSCIIESRGSCGNQQIILENILNSFNIENRRISIYMKKGGRKFNHAMNEIKINNEWMLVDITNGSVFSSNEKNIYSYEKLMKLDEKDRFLLKKTNILDLKYLVNSIDEGNYKNNYLPGFEYISDSTTIIGLLYDDNGFINVNLNETNNLEHIPNYIGTNTGTNNGIGLNLKFSNVSDSLVTIEVKDIAGCRSTGAVLIDSNNNKYSLKKGINTLNLKKNTSISMIYKPSQVCYATLEKISLN